MQEGVGAKLVQHTIMLFQGLEHARWTLQLQGARPNAAAGKARATQFC